MQDVQEKFIEKAAAAEAVRSQSSTALCLRRSLLDDSAVCVLHGFGRTCWLS